jgi:hypothetical protein
LRSGRRRRAALRARRSPPATAHQCLFTIRRSAAQHLTCSRRAHQSTQTAAEMRARVIAPSTRQSEWTGWLLVRGWVCGCVCARGRGVAAFTSRPPTRCSRYPRAPSPSAPTRALRRMGCAAFAQGWRRLRLLNERRVHVEDDEPLGAAAERRRLRTLCVFVRLLASCWNASRRVATRRAASQTWTATEAWQRCAVGGGGVSPVPVQMWAALSRDLHGDVALQVDGPCRHFLLQQLRKPSAAALGGRVWWDGVRLGLGLGWGGDRAATGRCNGADMQRSASGQPDGEVDRRERTLPTDAERRVHSRTRVLAVPVP